MFYKKNKTKPTELSRTLKMHQFNRSLFFRDNAHIMPTDFGEFPCVDRFTRDFDKKLLSVGSADQRENIWLTPKSSYLIDKYNRFKHDFLFESDELELSDRFILRKLCLYTNQSFNSAHTSSYISTRIKNNASPQKLITLNAFLYFKIGVCRHHALLNACFLSKLKKDGLLNGTIIHHRQNFPTRDTTHTWILFISTDGNLYSLDSSYRKVLQIPTVNDLDALDDLYDEPTVSQTIKRRLKQLELIHDNHFIPQVDCRPLRGSQRRERAASHSEK